MVNDYIPNSGMKGRNKNKYSLIYNHILAGLTYVLQYYRTTENGDFYTKNMFL